MHSKILVGDDTGHTEGEGYENFVDVRLKGVFLEGEQNHIPGTCSPRCPARQSLVKKTERSSCSLLWGREQVLCHALWSFEQGDLMY